MVADALIPYVARSSATMGLTLYEKQLFIFYEERFQQSVPYHQSSQKTLLATSPVGLVTVQAL